MGWHEIFARMRVLPARRRLARELAEETAFHLERMEAELRERGVPASEAAYAARRQFGNVLRIRERSAETFACGWAEGVVQDVRFGMRMLLRKPVFSLVVIAVLALGIGLNAAMFSIVQAVILQPLPYRDAKQLTIIWQSSPAHRATGEWFNAYREFEEWQKRSTSFAQLAALTWATNGYTVRRRGKLQSAVVIPVSTNFFSMLGIEARYGRVFEARDAESGCAVVASYPYWRDHLGADRHLPDVGLTLDGRPCQMVGVMPERFSFYPRETQIWMAITQDSEFVQKPWDGQTGVFGRLRSGVSRAAAEQELMAIQTSIAGERPRQNVAPPSVPVVLDLQQEFTWLTGRNLRQGLWLLSGAVALVLLIACVNVANLLLGRASERQREMAIRASIGCGRARMVRQLLTESLVLSSCGAAAGFALAALVLHIFRVVNPVELPPGNVVEMRWPALVFIATLSVACALLSGVAPAWKASRAELTAALKSDARTGNGVGQRSGKVLVVLQVALSLVLLSSAALLAASLVRLAGTPIGYRVDHLLTAELNLGARPKVDETAQARFAEEFLRRLSTVPGVRRVALTSSLAPLGSDVLAIRERTFNPVTTAHNTASQTISADYFETAEIPLLAGRDFTEADRRNTQAVAVINAELAREYFPQGNAVGRQIKLGAPDSATPWLTVVGVVGNVKSKTVFQEMGYVTVPVVYRPMTQTSMARTALLMRTVGEPMSMANPLVKTTTEMDRNLLITDIKSMQTILSEQNAQPRFRTVLLGGFAGMAMLLAALGIYGLLAQQVIQRTLEIGIRMALGANRRQIVERIVQQALGLTAMGIVLGVAGALIAGRVMAGLLYETRASDPWLLALVTVVLMLVALGASVAPAWRASRVEPMVSMRAE